MKLKYFLYGFLGLSVIFLAAMFYLLYFKAPSGAPSFLSTGSVFSEPAKRAASVVRDQGATVSGKSGKLVIAYAGDIVGSLDPCG